MVFQNIFFLNRLHLLRYILLRSLNAKNDEKIERKYRLPRIASQSKNIYSKMYVNISA